MLPNRTYNGLMDTELSMEELRREAALRASMGVRGRRRANLQLGADKKLLTGLYRRAGELKAEPDGALGALLSDFHVVERALLALEDREARLPALLHGPHTGLPRVYDIAACIVGRRAGRADEAGVSRFLEAYQAVTPLTMREVAALPDMLNAALVKLLALVCTEAMEAEKSCMAAEELASRPLRERGRRWAGLNSPLSEDAAFTERLYTLFCERDDKEGCEELNRRLRLEDGDIEALCAQARLRRVRGKELAENAIKSLRSVAAMDWQAAFERYSLTHKELHNDLTYCRMDARSRAYYRNR